jgi:hypothetical protein
MLSELSGRVASCDGVGNKRRHDAFRAHWYGPLLKTQRVFAWWFHAVV